MQHEILACCTGIEKKKKPPWRKLTVKGISPARLGPWCRPQLLCYKGLGKKPLWNSLYTTFSLLCIILWDILSHRVWTLSNQARGIATASTSRRQIPRSKYWFCKLILLFANLPLILRSRTMKSLTATCFSIIFLAEEQLPSAPLSPAKANTRLKIASYAPWGEADTWFLPVSSYTISSAHGLLVKTEIWVSQKRKLQAGKAQTFQLHVLKWVSEITFC